MNLIRSHPTLKTQIRASKGTTMAGQSKVGCVRGEDPDGNYSIIKVDDEGSLKVSGELTLSAPVTVSPLFKQTQTVTLPAVGGTYAVNDEVSNSATAGSVVPMTFTNVVPANGGTGYIVKAVLEASTPTVAAGVFRLWLYNQTPGPFSGNDAQFVFRKANKDKRIGFVDFALVTEGTGSDGAYGLDDGLRLAFQADIAARNLYGILVAKSTYAWTAAQTFDVTLIAEVA